MTASSRNSFQADLPTPSVSIKPSSSGLIVLDSKYRNEIINDPTDFNCKFNNAITAKEIYYRALTWNQSLYSHNNTNNLICFQVSDPDGQAAPIGDVKPKLHDNISPYFHVLLPPFQTYTSVDGNPPGSIMQPPKPGSYAYDVEYCLNNHCRYTSTNMITAPPSGFFDSENVLNDIRLVNDLYHVITDNPNDLKPKFTYRQTLTSTTLTIYPVLYFRYNPSTGFVLYAQKKTYTSSQSPYLLIRILPEQENWISNASKVHGFGRWSIEKQKYTPNTAFQIAYYAENQPTLLPYNLIMITSPELSRCRKSFTITNTPSSHIQEELAVLPVKYQDNGIFLTNYASDDVSVIPFQDNYSPQQCYITIRNIDGTPLKMDFNIQKALDALNAFYHPPYPINIPTFTETLLGQIGMIIADFSSVNIDPTGLALASYYAVCFMSIGQTPYGNQTYTKAPVIKNQIYDPRYSTFKEDHFVEDVSKVITDGSFATQGYRLYTLSKSDSDAEYCEVIHFLTYVGKSS